MDNSNARLRNGILAFFTIALFLCTIWHMGDWKNQGVLFWTFYFIGHFIFFSIVSGMIGIIIASLGFGQFYTEYEDWFHRIIYVGSLYPYMTIHLYIQGLFIE